MTPVTEKAPRLPWQCWATHAGVAIGWLLFLGSFLLPALNSVETAGTLPGTPVTGWQALRGLALVFHPLVVFAKPSILILFPAILLANIVAVVTPLIYLSSREHSWLVSPLLLLGAACGELLPEMITGQVFVGYYLWLGSLVILAVSCALAPATERLRPAKRFGRGT